VGDVFDDLLEKSLLLLGLLLYLLASCDVSYNADGIPLSAQPHPGHGDFNREFCSVFPQCLEFHRLVDEQALAGAKEVFGCAQMPSVMAFWYNQVS
jgi:hypothetical protein